MILARNWNSPIDFWLGLPLSELRGWIQTNNEIINEENQARKKR